MTQQPTAIEAILRRERLIVVTGLLLIVALAWSWIVVGAGTGMNILAMTTSQFPPPVRAAMVETWTPTYALVMFFMWWIMMIAMMTPSAAPMVLLYGRAYRHEQRLGKLTAGIVPTFAFVVGYLFAWGVFSAIAAGLQWGFERAGLIHQMLMWSINPYFTAGILILTGLYQLTPLKAACLKHCRSPAQFLSSHFKPGINGALRLGWSHGFYCIGCCWFLMALLFAGGIMNLFWIVGLALFVLVEKIIPRGELVARSTGVVLIALGLLVAAGRLQ